jgi:hypothetical protein
MPAAQLGRAEHDPEDGDPDPGHSADALARDHGISRATAHRYLGEVVAVLAARAPDLRDALERASKDGLSHVILDGKIIACDRCKEPAISVKGEVIDLWYSGNRTADLADMEAALAAHPDSFLKIPHFDGYRAGLIRLPQVTGAALREAMTRRLAGVRAAPARPGFPRRLASPPSCHPIGRHDSVPLDREC